MPGAVHGVWREPEHGTLYVPRDGQGKLLGGAGVAEVRFERARDTRARVSEVRRERKNGRTKTEEVENANPSAQSADQGGSRPGSDVPELWRVAADTPRVSVLRNVQGTQSSDDCGVVAARSSLRASDTGCCRERRPRCRQRLGGSADSGPPFECVPPPTGVSIRARQKA